MSTITSFTAAQNVLRPYYDNSRTPYTLDAMRTLMQYLGNPQEKIKVVHVAGTSGKTSTAYYVAALLKAGGQSVGLSVSPHVDTVNERLQVNGQPLPEAEFCAVLSEFLELIQNSGVKPSYFELLAAMAYWEFARRGLAYAVMEVGLGGLLDATNVVQRADKVCIITDIGLDHTEILGDTIQKIAVQKAGIIQPQNAVFMYDQGDEVMSVVVAVVTKQQADLHAIEPATTAGYVHLPPFQQRNFGLAVQAVDYVLQRDTGTTLDDENKLTSSRITIPARLERFELSGKTIIVDGSHNQQKMQALLQGMEELYPGQQFATLCAFVKGNDERWQGALLELFTTTNHIVFTAFHSEQDLPKTSVDVDQIVRFCELHGFQNYTVAQNPVEAFEALLARQESVLLVTGSFYLLNHIRPLLMEQT